jgi:hypothetical protein
MRTTLPEAVHEGARLRYPAAPMTTTGEARRRGEAEMLPVADEQRPRLWFPATVAFCVALSTLLLQLLQTRIYARYGATGGVVDAIRTRSGRIPSLWVLSSDGKVDPMRAASGARTGHFTRIRERSLSQSETGRV